MAKSRRRKNRKPSPPSSAARWSGREKLRVLVGPYILAEHCAYMEHAFDDFDTLTFGAYDGADIKLEGLYSLEMLIDALPKGWAPDLMLLWRPEYTMMPLGLERAEFPVAMLISDWYISFTSCMEVARFVNAVVTGTRGERVYCAAGFNHVLNMPMLGYQEGVDGAYASEVRDIDVLCAGNPNWNVHRERERVVRTLMGLPAEVRFVHSPMVGREQYNLLLSRAKIFVNQTVIGEINMKCYEVPAAGACLFVEEDNLDMRRHLVPGKSVVLFNRQNLNEKILYYLRHEDERRAIAEAGQKAMRARSYRANMFDVVERLRKMGRTKLLSMGREIRRASLAEMAGHYMGYAARHTGFGLQQALDLSAKLPDELGVKKALIQGTLQYTASAGPVDERTGQRWRGVWPSDDTLEYVESAWQETTDDLCLNLAWAQMAGTRDDFEGQKIALDRLVDQLEGGCRVPLGGANLYTLPQRQRFLFERRAWEEVERGFPPDAALRSILLEYAYDLRAGVHLELGHEERSVQDLRNAVGSNPSSVLTRHKLVDLLMKRGEREEATEVGLAHLEQAPTDVAMRVRLLENEARRGRFESAEKLLHEAKRIASVFCDRELLEKLLTIEGRLFTERPTHARALLA
jgi:tetratricopeptide (TPR) repeat protein